MKIIATKARRHEGFIYNKTFCVTLCLRVLVAIFIAALLVVVLLLAAGCKERGRPGIRQAIRILTFGDSITRGVREGVKENQTFTYYLGLFFEKDGFSVEMVRKGVSGETTGGALSRLERDVLREKPGYVLVMYGTNDAFIDAYDSANDLPRISIEKYRKNLHVIVRKLRKNNIKPVLMTPIPMGEFWGSDVGIYRRNGINFKLKEYVAVVRRVAAKENVLLVDHFNEWLKWQKRGKDINTWMTDGLHPNPKGHRFMAAVIFKVLRKELMK